MIRKIKIRLGDIVKFKAGGPKMVVTYAPETRHDYQGGENTYECLFFIEGVGFQSNNFYEHQLVLVK